MQSRVRVSFATMVITALAVVGAPFPALLAPTQLASLIASPEASPLAQGNRI